jgi:ketosteroid isomerase-like protein
MRVLLLPFTISIGLLLAGCGHSKNMTTGKAQHALDQVPHTGGSATVVSMRVQHEADAIFEVTFKDFGYTDHEVAKKSTGPGAALFTKTDDGHWKLSQIHLGEPPVYLNYDIAAD